MEEIELETYIAEVDIRFGVLTVGQNCGAEAFGSVETNIWNMMSG